ncbi:radial spoke head 10 homolog B-like isoform X1 [Vespa velutina]|uniref:radial spoke head 10 homolog B-like isoform X1 n=1 Tax=Vespa velutina TaxID=202808 RepID=UPI001FB53D34|nr:radial spoke head 10 homolog B-like isoform X1 [Vespa velutina]
MMIPEITENEENLQEQSIEQEEEEIIKEDINYAYIAKEHHKYSAKDKFIYSLYKDLIKYFIIEYDGQLTCKCITSQMLEDENEKELSEDIIEKRFNNNNLTRDKTNKLYLKSNLKDKNIHFFFINNNTYFGCTSRKMMNNEGLYKWHHGVQYKGQFKKNQIEGRGILEWQSNCWYEGEFMNGYRHGKGTLLDKDNYRLYIGQWYMGYRHGKGYCCYAEGDSYDGDWSMGKRNGIGFYVYSSGAQYKGYWKNDFRHGNGIMAWSNGDIYYGEWEYGNMHGYGEYIWHGFCNKSFSWLQNILYFGNWYHSTKHGKGLLKLNSMGGTKYFGNWKYNKKDGYGMIIGNNGELMQDELLYSTDILVSLNAKISKIMEPYTTTILKPEQFPSLSYHINRLIQLSSFKNFSLHLHSLGKCYICNEQQSCSCLLRSSFKITNNKTILKNNFDKKWQYEKNQTYDYLTLHMLQIRNVYDIYATLFNKEESKCHFIMIKLMLWQLWRDCNLNIKGLSLIEIDNYITENESSLIKKPYYPFEKIEIWQFLHALLEVSWRIYYWKNNKIKKETHWKHGILVKCLNEFLTHDVYPNVGNFVGIVPREYNLLPIYSIYKLYKQVGYPPTATDMLIACIKDHTVDVNEPVILSIPEYILNGLNCVIIGEKINFLPRDEKPFMQTEMQIKRQGKDTRELLLFQDLGPVKIVQIMTKVCPLIKDNDDNTILNMNYLLTFLEFYEIILEAAKCIVESRKKKDATIIPFLINTELI